MNLQGPTQLPYSKFLQVLQLGNSPAAGEALGMYNIFKEYGIPAELGLAFFFVESKLGTLGICKQYNTKSIGNVRSAYNKAYNGIDFQTPQGQYTKYPTWTAGVRDWCERLLGVNYVQAGLTTIEKIMPVYAPSNDNNDPIAYAASLETLIKGWGVTPPKGKTMVAKPKITYKPSPNFYAAGNNRQDVIVWHITAGSGGSALSWLTNPASDASSNYLIMEDGTIYCLVDPETGKAPWTNGIDYNQYPYGKKPDLSNPFIADWTRNKINPNKRTVSIEHAGDNGQSLNQAQINASIQLTAWLCERFNIVPDRTHIIKHGQIDGIDRPYCPGFTEAQYADRIAKIKALVSGTTTKTPIEVIKEEVKVGGIVASYVDQPGPFVKVDIDENGEPFMVIKFGGQMKAAPNANIQDVGITGIGMDNAEYDRSVKNNAFTEYHRTPR